MFLFTLVYSIVIVHLFRLLQKYDFHTLYYMYMCDVAQHFLYLCNILGAKDDPRLRSYGCSYYVYTSSMYMYMYMGTFPRSHADSDRIFAVLFMLIQDIRAIKAIQLIVCNSLIKNSCWNHAVLQNNTEFFTDHSPNILYQPENHSSDSDWYFFGCGHFQLPFSYHFQYPE